MVVGGGGGGGECVGGVLKPLFIPCVLQGTILETLNIFHV